VQGHPTSLSVADSRVSRDSEQPLKLIVNRVALALPWPMEPCPVVGEECTGADAILQEKSKVAVVLQSGPYEEDSGRPASRDWWVQEREFPQACRVEALQLAWQRTG
jgi:hypothetical protein